MTMLGDVTYLYDAAGQRTSVGGSLARTGIPAALTSATYDAGNRLTAWDATSFSYDPNGNLTSDGLTSYTWNARNQLVGMSGGTSASFAYDALERRRTKTVGGTATNFLYDGENSVQELTSGGTPTANMLTGLGVDQTFTRTDASGTSTLLIDALGSALALADTSGAVQTQFTFEPFGNTTSSGATSSNAVQFTGRENDATGLYFYRARYYSPQLQRFISDDPIGFAGGDVNVYAYAGNQPTGRRDPSGLRTFLPLPAGCGTPPAGGRKDPPRPWWMPCPLPIIILPIPDLIPAGPLLPWWPEPPSPPPGSPRPPGWTPDWDYRYPEGPEPPARWRDLPDPRYFDPDGGEWRLHPSDPWHSDPHWDQNPWQHPYDLWRNIPLNGNG
jgi:RHS repeat-associated protein